MKADLKVVGVAIVVSMIALIVGAIVHAKTGESFVYYPALIILTYNIGYLLGRI